MIETTIAQPAQPTTTREKGTCSGCGTTTKTLTAPHSGARNYTGPMFCLGCNPRFAGEAGTVDMHFSALERLEA